MLCMQMNEQHAIVYKAIYEHFPRVSYRNELLRIRYNLAYCFNSPVKLFRARIVDTLQ